MKHTPTMLGIVSVGWLVASAAFAGSVNLTVSIDASKQGSAYSSNFAGLSVETGVLKPNNGTTGYMFDTNTTQSPKANEVINLVKNMGLKNIRIGGGSVDSNTWGTDYTNTGIDAFFNFAKTTGINVIYSLRLLNGNQTDDASIASHIYTNYSAQLSYFAIGNEPNWHSYHTTDPLIYETTSGQPGTAYPSYVHNSGTGTANGDWKNFAATIKASVANASFGGPDTGDEGTSTATWWNNGTKNVSWTQAFVDDRKSGNISVPIIAGLTHYYVGGGGTVDPLTATTAMLSKGWVTTNYPNEYNSILSGVVSDGWHYRFTECNDYLGTVTTASSTFAAALWALDFMHWEAAHNTLCMGVNFHNKGGTNTVTIYPDANGDYHAYPKAAAIKMFDLGGHGNLMTGVTVSNPSAANVDCYAVGTSTDLYVTIINKTSQYVGDWTAAVTTIAPTNFTVTSAEYITMDSYPTTKDVTATDATVGGSAVNNNAGAWAGTWTPLTVASNQCSVTVSSASAVVVHLH